RIKMIVAGVYSRGARTRIPVFITEVTRYTVMTGRMSRGSFVKSIQLLVALAFASTAFAATCPSAVYSVYLVPGFRCTLGNLTFGSFGYVTTANPAAIA